MVAEAEECVGTRSMAGKQRILIQHTESLKGTMFKKAKDEMLTVHRSDGLFTFTCEVQKLKFFRISEFFRKIQLLR